MSDREDDETTGLLSKRRQVQADQVGRCAGFCEEFRLRNLRFRWPTPLVFYRSQWRWALIIFVMYRIIVTGYVTFWFGRSVYYGPKINGFLWPMYLTSWAYTLLTLHLWVAIILSIGHLIEQRHFCCQAPPLHRSMGTPISPNDLSYPSFNEDGQDDVGFVMPSDRLPWYCKLSWLMFTVIANGAIIVSAVYFAALYPQIYKNGRFPSLEDFNLHAVNSIIILLELILSSLPLRLLHALYVFCFGAIYLIFSVFIFYFYNSKPIYPHVLDWNHPGTTIGFMSALMFLAIPLVQLLLFGIYKLRVMVFNKIYDFD